MSLTCHNKSTYVLKVEVSNFITSTSPSSIPKWHLHQPKWQILAWPPKKSGGILKKSPGSPYRCLGHHHCDGFVQMACWYQYRGGSWCRCSYLFHVLCMELSRYLWGHCEWLGMRWLDGDVFLEMLGRILFSIQIAHIKKETNSNCTYIINHIWLDKLFNGYFQYMKSIATSMLKHLVFQMYIMHIYLYLDLGPGPGGKKSRWRRWNEDLFHPWTFLLYLSHSLLEDFESWQRSRSGLGEMARADGAGYVCNIVKGT